ncbi:hypothetical protein [Candidatus Midichloria mitochondrii]|uniref:hypothetical protein n=1 Tax=Candidatus Midichloria mitochondrii TaxID=234827 RepID=UPI001F2969BD|nr:hypothetical protein [Candidatus Midichloria mitochondrii]
MLQREINRYVDSTKSWKRFVITHVLAVIRSLKASLSVGNVDPDGSLASMIKERLCHSY